MQVIYDTDPGNGFPGSDIDDGLALGLLLKSPEFQLDAVTIVGGNTPVAWGERSGLRILELAGSTAPLYLGSTRPILEDASVWRRELDGRADNETTAKLWQGIEQPRPAGRAETERAANAIVRLVNDSPGEITIIAVGPLTNIAEAILLDPTLPQKVARIAIMGGGFGVWHNLQELNFCYDPEAARIVVTSGAPITLVPLDTTLKTYLTLEQNERLKASDQPLTRFLGETCEPWIRWIANHHNRDGCALHDPLVVAAILDPSLVTIDRVRVDVELAGRLTRGRAVSWQPEMADLKENMILHQLHPIEVAVGVNNGAFVDLLLGRLVA